MTVITDSDNLAQSLRKDAGQIADKRLRTVISVLRQTLEIELFSTIKRLPVELLEAFLGPQKVSPKPLKSYTKEVNLANTPMNRVGGCTVAPAGGGRHPPSANLVEGGTPHQAPYPVGGLVPLRPEGEVRRNSIMRSVQRNVRNVLVSGVSVRAQ